MRIGVSLPSDSGRSWPSALDRDLPVASDSISPIEFKFLHHFISLDSCPHCAQGDDVRCEAPLAVLSLALPNHSQRNRFPSLRHVYITVSLPEDTDGSKVTADFKDGMLSGAPPEIRTSETESH